MPDEATNIEQPLKTPVIQIETKKEKKEPKERRKPTSNERYLTAIISRESKRLLKSRAALEDVYQDTVVDRALSKYFETPATKDAQLARLIESILEVDRFDQLDRLRRMQAKTWSQFVDQGLVLLHRSITGPAEAPRLTRATTNSVKPPPVVTEGFVPGTTVTDQTQTEESGVRRAG